MNEVHRDTLVEFLKHRKSCDLCLKDRCNKKCEHVRNYTYAYMEKMYNQAIEVAEKAENMSKVKKRAAERMKEIFLADSLR